MKKQLQNKVVYQPNKGVKITVVNKPEYDETVGQIAGYTVDVIIKVVRKLQPQELKFATDDDVADFIGTIDVEDPQQSLLS